MTSAISKRRSLSWELTVTLVLKLVVIYLLWLWFFSEPLDDELTSPDVGKALFGTPAAQTSVPPTESN